MNALKRLASDTALYGLSSIIGRILNYLLVPLYTSRLLPAEYGIITEVYAYIAFLNILYGYGMETAYFRFANQERPIENFRLTTSLLLLSSFLFSGLLVLFAPYISNWLGYGERTAYVYYIAAIVGVDTLLIIPFAWLRLNQYPVRFAQAKCLQIGINITLNLLLLYIIPKIYTGTFLSYYTPLVQRIYHPTHHVSYIFLSNLLANLCVLPLLHKPLSQFKWQLDWKKIRPLISYSFPLLVMGLAATTNEMLSRVLLKHLLPAHFYPGHTPEAIVGVFGAIYKLAILIALATQAFRYAADPFFFAHAQDKNAKQLFSKVMYGYVLVACFIWFATSVNIELLGAIFLRNPVYQAHLSIVPYLSWAYVWLGIYYNLSIWFKLANKTHYGSIITLIGAAITIALNFLLVPYYGYWGSVCATLGSHFTMTILCYYKGQQYYHIPYQTGRLLGIISITWILIQGTQYISYNDWTALVISNIGFTFLFGIATCIALYHAVRR